MKKKTVLVTGAYGQVGAVAIPELLDRGYTVLATGRNQARLDALKTQYADAPVSTRRVDVEDTAELAVAAREAEVLFNCVGPYVRNGDRVARIAVETGLHYVDFAGEQEHYRRVASLADMAKEGSVALAPGFGLYPGLSGPLAHAVLKRHPGADSLTIGLFAGNHLSADAGLASLLAAVLEMNYDHEVVRDGKLELSFPAQPTREFTFPEPYGTRLLVSWPQLDILTLHAEAKASSSALRLVQTFAQLGVAAPPSRFLVRFVRMLRPHRSEWSYAFLKRILRRVNARNYHEAEAEGLDSGGAIIAIAERSGSELGRGTATFKDGARGTVWLAARVVEELLIGRRHGLLSPQQVFDADSLLAEAVKELGDVRLNFVSNTEEQ